MPSDKSKTPEDDDKRAKHQARPTGQGTHVKGDAAKGADKLDKLFKDWKADIDSDD